MYEQYYNLSARPFQLNPDPKFFYRSKGHKRAMAYMRYGMQQEQGFIVVTGDVGTGKTMLVNNLFKEIENENVVAAKIVSTNVKDVDLLRLLAAEFDIPFDRQTKAALLTTLETFFRSCITEGKRVLLVIDEAQNLPRSALEELRMLSNFDHDGVPLVQSFLLGQREFRAVMRAPGLEQLRQRVIAAYHLKPLSASEVKEYVEHRMSKVGWTDNPRIADEVYHGAYVATGGVPRRINTLFDRLLLNGYLDEEREISIELLEAVKAEIEAEQGDPNEISDPAIRMPRWDGPVSTGAPGASANAPAAGGSVEFEKIQERLNRMEQMIGSLGDKLQQKAAQALDIDREASKEDEKSFPLWTTTFLSVVTALIVVVTVLGYFVWAD